MLHAILFFAQAYGSGAYSSGSYGGSSPLLQIGPLSLPNTGAGWAVIIGAAILGLAGGLAMAIYQHRKTRRRLLQTQGNE